MQSVPVFTVLHINAERRGVCWSSRGNPLVKKAGGVGASGDLFAVVNSYETHTFASFSMEKKNKPKTKTQNKQPPAFPCPANPIEFQLC